MYVHVHFSYGHTLMNECNGGPLGQNLALGWSLTGANDPAAQVRTWVSERNDYDYVSKTCAAGKVCGHYTQVVWHNSIKVRVLVIK